MNPTTSRGGGAAGNAGEDEVDVDVDEEEEEIEVDADDDEMEEVLVDDEIDEDEEMVDESTEVELDDEEEDVTEVEVDESEVFSDEGTYAPPPIANEPPPPHSASVQEKVQEFEDWLWDSRRQSTTTAGQQSLTSADVYTTTANEGADAEIPGNENDNNNDDDDDDTFPVGSSSFFAPNTIGGDDNDYDDPVSSSRRCYDSAAAASTTSTVGALASGEMGYDDSLVHHRDDSDESNERDDTDTSTLLAVANPDEGGGGRGIASSSDAFEDEPYVRAQKKKTALASPADGNTNKPLRAFGALPLVDKVLILLIAIVILILLTALPITLTRSKSRNVVPVVPTKSPTGRPTFIPTAAPTTSNMNRYGVVGGPFVATPGSQFGAAIAGLFFLSGNGTVSSSNPVRIALVGAPNAGDGQGAAPALVDQRGTARRRLQRDTPTEGTADVPERTQARRQQRRGLGNPSVEQHARSRNAQDTNSWLNQSSLLLQENGTAGFGFALYGAGTNAAVGSPGTTDGTGSPPGAAYVYQYTESATPSPWVGLGSALVEPASNGTATTKFGSAVAVSNATNGDGAVIAAVSAPQYQNGDGAVYTYFYESSTNSWQPLSSTDFPITYVGSNEQLGSALDISRDGQHLVVGAPSANGGMGRFVAYQWNVAGSDWLQVFEQAGTMANGKLGSSVVYLSGRRDYIAVGAPGTLDGSGLVQLYQKSSGSLGYEQVGSDVTGQSNEQLGSPGTIAGSIVDSAQAIVLLLGTALGTVRRLDFNLGANEWTTTFAAIDTGLSAPVTALSSEEGGGTVMVGVSSVSTAIIYAESTAPTTRAPTIAPATAAPSSASVAPSSLSPSTTAPNATESPTTPNSTTAPSAAPQPQWTLASGPLSGSSSSFGADVAVVQSFVAVGDPGGTGSVYTYTRLNQDWVDLAEISGPTTQSGSLFGSSLAFNPSDNSLLVGAPGVYASNTQTPVGAAYYYTLSGSVWTQQGGPIAGDASVFAANEGFGSSVAVSNSGVVAIGAPNSNAGSVLGRGRIYTFVLDSASSSWVPRGGGNGTLLVGTAQGNELGYAVALSPDGSTLVAGAPGAVSGAGALLIYSWTGSAWSQVTSRRGNSTSERLGTTVAILTSDGSFLAVGGPGYGGGAGVIRVFQRQQQQAGYALYGVPIVGEGNEALGGGSGGSSLSGSVDSSGVPTILAGTSSGAIKTLRFNSQTSAWDESVDLVTTSIGTNPSVSGSTSLGLMVAGRQGVANIYALV